MGPLGVGRLSRGTLTALAILAGRLTDRVHGPWLFVIQGVRTKKVWAATVSSGPGPINRFDVIDKLMKFHRVEATRAAILSNLRTLRGRRTPWRTREADV